MSPLEKRVEQLECQIVQLEETIHGLLEEKSHKVERLSRRHTRSFICDPERAIKKAQEQNALLFSHGLKITITTIAVCVLCWGGFELYEMADHYFNHQGSGLPEVALDKITSQ